jgi:hypothetical protein
MSRIEIIGRSRIRRRRKYSSAGSPCSRIVSRTVRRRSGTRPERAGTVRRVRRRGGVSRIRFMIRRSAASSAGVQAANDLRLSASTSDAIQPRTASSSSPSPSGLVAGATRVASASASTRAFSVTSSRTGSAPPRKNRRNTWS